MLDSVNINTNFIKRILRRRKFREGKVHEKLFNIYFALGIKMDLRN